MAETTKLNRPWLLAVWPGMGQVASTAGFYLMAKLGMEELDEFQVPEAFDVERVVVDEGLIQAGRLPRSRVFVWRDPNEQHDLLVFTGEAQPEQGKYAFCRALIDYAQRQGVERVFTFAAMATGMHPERDARVFGAATDAESLAELRRLELEILEDGHIGGLNGVLLGVAAERGLRGTCLLGEIPQFFAQVPFPKASAGVLDAFATMAGLDLELKELAEQAREVEQQLGRLLTSVQQQFRQKLPAPQGKPEVEAESQDSEPDEPGLAPVDEARIERLFAESAKDRARAYELKRTLDRLGAFADYEDRFLDLFRRAG